MKHFLAIDTHEIILNCTVSTAIGLISRQSYKKKDTKMTHLCETQFWFLTKIVFFVILLLGVSEVKAETKALLCDFSNGVPLKTGKYQIAIEEDKFCFGETAKEMACVERVELKASSPVIETKTCELDCRALREAQGYFEFSNIFENIVRLSGKLDRYNGNLSLVSNYRGNNYETFFSCRASDAKRLF